MENLFAPTVNLALLLIVLFYKLRAPLKTFITQRHVSMRDEVQAVQEKLKKAQDQYHSYSARLEQVGQEVLLLQEQCEKEVQAVRQRVKNEVAQQSQWILQDSKNRVDGLFSELRDHLYREYGFKVLQRAEDLIRAQLKFEDQVQVREAFASRFSLKNEQGGH